MNYDENPAIVKLGEWSLPGGGWRRPERRDLTPPQFEAVAL